MDTSSPNPSGLVCIEYPGLVQNVDKAVATLGGLATIGQVVAEPNRRLELRFRPDDVYCKPACGERHHGSAFLLRVKKMRLKKGREGKGKPETKMECNVEGTVDVSYRFTNLCDFQYLPMARSSNGEEGTTEARSNTGAEGTTGGEATEARSSTAEEGTTEARNSTAEEGTTEARNSTAEEGTTEARNSTAEEGTTEARNSTAEEGTTEARNSTGAEGTTGGEATTGAFNMGNLEKKAESGEADLVPDTPSHLSIYDKVYFKKLVPSNWLEKPAPLFIPPAAFSRMDLPQDYQYRREASAASDKAVTTPHNIIGRTRQRRSHHAIFVTYDVEQVPTKPRDVALNQLKLKFIDQERFQTVKEKFTERPAWSKNALNAITRISAERLKFMLPALAFYFTTGPWRNQWIRFGYDPRKDPQSAKYQTLDYRVRLQGGARHKVTAKRSYANYLLPYKAINWSKPRTSVINKTSFPGAEQMKGEDVEEGEKEKEEKEKLLDVYLFREGRIPPYRQMFYQYGDLQLESVQELLASCPKSAKCDEKSGWFPAGTEEKLREILTQNINSKLTAERLEEDGQNDSALQSDSPDSQSETEIDES